jgi:hypothetical protein
LESVISRAHESLSINQPKTKGIHMNKLIVALIAGTFTAVASAQAPMTDAEKTKCADMLRGKVSSLTKQERARCADLITSSTAGQGGTSGQAEAMDANALKGQKGTPKALPTREDKRKAVDAATAAGSESSVSAQGAAAGAAAAKAEKSMPKALPTKEDKRKAVDTATKTEAGK